MDTSKEYIEMCKKATELQTAWAPNQGDYIINTWTASGTPHLFVNHKYQPKADDPAWELMCDKREDHLIWLPRQDQLQDILMDTFPETSPTWQRWDMLEAFYKFVDFKDCDKDKLPDDETFEQYWLHFLMKTKYNKVWDNDSKEWRIFDDKTEE